MTTPPTGTNGSHAPVGFAGDLPRKIGFWGGSAIMVGIIIGSGIFRTPASIAQQLGNPMVILLLWLAGGILAFFGALAYAELATMFPRSGGIYNYLHQGLGGVVAFVFGWTYLLITKPLAAAGITTVFAEHFNTLFGLSWSVPLITCGVLLVLTAINTLGMKLGAGVAMVLTSLKVGALLAIIALGLILARGTTAHFSPVETSKTFFQALVPVMAAIMWTYDGWSDVAAVSGEVKNPQKMLPRIFLLGTAMVIVIYVAVNAVYISMISLTEMRQVKTVAPLVMERLLGPAGAVAVTIVILISTLGASHASIITGARVTFAQARSGLLFGFLGRIHPKFETPAVSLWMQAALSCTASLVYQSFERLTEGFVFTMWIFYGLAMVSIIVLRIRRPDLERPYRCWGYPFVPGVFLLVALGMTVLSIVESPTGTLPWLAILLAGVPMYYLWRWLTNLQEKVSDLAQKVSDLERKVLELQNALPKNPSNT